MTLSRQLLFDVFHIALKKVGQLLNGGAERNPEAEFGQINCRPRPLLLEMHGSLHRFCFNTNRRWRGSRCERIGATYQRLECGHWAR
jgi:hypothetical protein